MTGGDSREGGRWLAHRLVVGRLGGWSGESFQLGEHGTPVSPREEDSAGSFQAIHLHAPSDSKLLFGLVAASNGSVERGKPPSLVRCRPVPASESMEGPKAHFTTRSREALLLDARMEGNMTLPLGDAWNVNERIEDGFQGRQQGNRPPY